MANETLLNEQSKYLRQIESRLCCLLTAVNTIGLGGGAGGSGTVESVASGVGLTGGPITTTGTLSLATTLQPMATLAGNASKYLRVNAGATAVEWATISSGEVPLTFSTGLTRTANTITSNLSTGIAGGQSVIGGTAAGNNLTISSTTNGTKGSIIFGAASLYDEVNNYLGIGTTTPNVKLQVAEDLINYLGPGQIEITGASNENKRLILGLDTNLNIGYIQAGTAGVGYNHVVLQPGGANLGIGGGGGAVPTALCHLGAGTASANSSPLKFTSGTNLTTIENGTIEYDGTNYFASAGGTRQTIHKGKAGLFSQVGAATTVFTVTFGGTQPNNTYKVNVTPTSSLSAAMFYVSNKTTTTFDVIYLAGLTGTVTFDYLLNFE